MLTDEFKNNLHLLIIFFSTTNNLGVRRRHEASLALWNT